MNLVNKTKENICKAIGLSYEGIISMTFEDMIKYVRGRNTTIIFNKKSDFCKIGHGNPLLCKRRFRTMDDVNVRL